MSRPDHTVATLAHLESLFGTPGETAILKERTALTPAYRRLIEAAPFFAFASVGEGGLDCSPRGDAPGFVRILDDTTLAIPDRNGNNRIDTLRNLIVDPRVALLFLIPGVGETIRVNGRAEISVDPELIDSFAVEGAKPRVVVVVHVERVYYQCARAIMRSHLWDPSRHVDRKSLPSSGDILSGIRQDFDGAAYDARMPKLLKDGLY